MKRKLIRQGSPEHGSHTITLPSSWIKRFGLKVGDEVDLNEVGIALTISSGKAVELPKTMTIDGRRYTHIGPFWKNISEAYRLGADTIKVLYENKKFVHVKTKRTIMVKDEIELIVTTLLGMEVERITPDMITITQFGETLEKEFDSAFRKLFFKLEEMIEYIISAMKTMDKEALRNTWFVDRGVNKLYNFCIRVLNKRGYADYKRTIQMSAILAQLELLGDYLDQIAYFVQIYNMKKVGPEVITALQELKKAITSYAKYFYEQKEEYAESLLNIRKRMYDLEKDSLETGPASAGIIAKIGSALNLMMNMQDSAFNIETQHKH